MFAASPAELETLFEDAFLLGDDRALVELFEPGAVVAGADGQQCATEVEGSELWRTRRWSGSRRIVSSAQTAVVLGAGAVSVLRRGEDGSWRYAIWVIDHLEAG